MKNKRFIIFILAIVLMVVALATQRDNLFTAYVSFKEAIQKPDRRVQVIGKLDKSIPVKMETESFSFTFTDKAGDSLNVVSSRIKPTNFEHAEQIVALGKYSTQEKLFRADEIMVKCPSKYKKKNIIKE
ncbi:MAG: cytochrome c maturation protein CcmE [bacterium]|nr:cytochrome c maturation protein CcmE [bacterium]